MLFTIFAILTLAGAVAAISLRNLVHSVLALTVTFAGLAALYLLLGAQFIGFAQILVYVGAVAILVVFAILLTRHGRAISQDIPASFPLGSIAIVFGVFGTLAWSICHSAVDTRAMPPYFEASTQQIGRALMLRFALPLEIIGLLLTAALIGAVTIAIREDQEAR